MTATETRFAPVDTTADRNPVTRRLFGLFGSRLMPTPRPGKPHLHLGYLAPGRWSVRTENCDRDDVERAGRFVERLNRRK